MQPARAGTSTGRDPAPPRVWLVMGYRTGENSQIRALGEALSWPFECKEIAHRRWKLITNLRRGTGLDGIIKTKSSPLVPPWPELVISAGVRNEPVCRWIRAQAGGKVKLVHIGRPWGRPQQFDLVVVTPQYRLPDHPHVLQNTLALHGLTGERLAQAAATWAPRLARLPRPWIAVLMGGNSGPYTLGPKAGRHLGREAGLLARQSGGSLLVTTSARTDPSALAALQDVVDVPMHSYRWMPDTAENPYYGYLALADSLVVTGDSGAMLAEACATCKPVYIFDLGNDRECAAARHADMDFRLSGFFYRQLMRTGPQRLTRDLGLIHQQLIASGRAVWLGDEFPPRQTLAPPDDMARAVRRVKALFYS